MTTKIILSTLDAKSFPKGVSRVHAIRFYESKINKIRFNDYNEYRTRYADSMVEFSECWPNARLKFCFMSARSLISFPP